jgi:hypothetical protein
MTMTQRIPDADLLRARRKMCRQIAAAIIGAMADEDMGFDQVAARLDVPETAVRRWMKQMIDGTSHDLDAVSDMTLAMGCEMVFSLPARQPLNPEMQPELVAA